MKKMAFVYLLVGLVLIVLAFAAWWHFFFGTANPQLPTAAVTVSSTPASASAAAATSTPMGSVTPPPGPQLDQVSIDGATITAEIASTTTEQTRGLSYRTSLGANDGMLFVFSTGSVQQFWMIGMNFPLDMIWISGNTVVGFAQNVPAPAPGTAPWNLPLYSSPANTDKVLEVNAGTVAKYGIKVGDTVTIAPAG